MLYFLSYMQKKMEISMLQQSMVMADFKRKILFIERDLNLCSQEILFIQY